MQEPYNQEPYDEESWNEKLAHKEYVRQRRNADRRNAYARKTPEQKDADKVRWSTTCLKKHGMIVLKNRADLVEDAMVHVLNLDESIIPINQKFIFIAILAAAQDTQSVYEGNQ